MKFSASLLLLSSSLLPHTTLAQNSDSEVTASWEQSGTCAYFFEKPGAWKSLAQTCIKYCENQPDGHGYSECDHTPYKDFDLPDGIPSSNIMQDDSGDVYVPCKCKCSNPDVEGITNAILDVVIEGLSHLDEIICGVFMTAMVSVVEIGIDLIPGGAEATAAARAVQGVKSFTENALDVADSMGNWVGKTCGIEDPNWPNSIFDVLLAAPDSYGTSIGCKKKNKADCKNVDPVPDKPKSKGIDEPATKQPDPVTSAPQADPTSADTPPVTSEVAPPVSSEVVPPVSSEVAPPVTSEAAPPVTSQAAPPVSSDVVPPVSTDVPAVSTNVEQPSASNEVPPVSTNVEQPSASNDVPPASTNVDQPPVSTDVPPVSTNVDQPTASVDPTASVTPTVTTSVDPSATSSTASSSTTDDCGSGTATQSGSSCEATTPCQIANPERGGDEAMLEDVMDAMTSLTGILRIRGIDGHRSPRSVHRLSKRDKKSGKPCSGSSNTAYKDWTLASDEYPSNGDLAANVDSWGYKKANNLCEYDWLDGKTMIAGNDYDSEHVMEWQIVTDFFQKLQAKGGLNYDHPDPSQAGTKTDFCTYWIESWTLDATQAFSVDNSAPLLPWEHIAAAYPSKKNYKEEMIRLQNNINQRAKANLFTDTIPYVWNEVTMTRYVKSNRDKVLERMRLLLGARTYLVDPKITAIFKKQKERMGAILSSLDTSMETHTRTATQTTTDPVTGAVTTSTVTYAAWKKQDLLAEWNAYMDAKWADATAKHKKVMDKFVNDLDDAHCQSPAKQTPADRKFCERLRKLQAAYNTVTAFSKPW